MSVRWSQWRTGATRAEIAVRKLELNSSARLQLILRKLERIQEIDAQLERYEAVDAAELKPLLREELLRAQDVSSEYSAMVKAVIRAKGGPEAT